MYPYSGIYSYMCICTYAYLFIEVILQDSMVRFGNGLHEKL